MAYDPVVTEVDVYHSHSLAENLSILQYPLRPAHLPYESVCGAKVSGCGCVRLDVSVRPRGDNYSTSRGEGYAKMSQLGSKGNERQYKSGLWDTISLESGRPSEKPQQRYVAAVLKDGELHLNSIAQVLQLRPSLGFLDAVEAGAKASAAAVGSDGETTGSEADEPVVPVTVKFARRFGKPQTASLSNSLEREWSDIAYHDRTSQEATEERGLLFSTDDSNVLLDMSPARYLDNVCPVDTPSSQGEPVTMPTGVISLSSLKELPLDQQVQRVLANAIVMQYSQLCSLLGGHSAALLRGVVSCAVLVQGCWVFKSSLLTPDNKSKADSRDFILWSFTQKTVVSRKDIVGVVKLSHDELRDVMVPLATQRGGGWEFKLATDHDFLSRHSSVAHTQERVWSSRYSQLSNDLDLKTPAGTKGLTEFLDEFVMDSIGRGVVSFTELKDKLLLKQSSVSEDHPLRLGGVSQALLRETVDKCGAVQIVSAQKTLFSFTHGHKVREIVLDLFKSHKAIRKKQVVDAVRTAGLGFTDKEISNTIKELCYAKGSQWKLQGMD